MSRPLTAIAQAQITNKRISIVCTFTINGVNYSSYLKTENTSFTTEFGSASANFVLHNPSGLFNEGGASQIDVGDVVSYKESYEGDSIIYNKFYGKVDQRSSVVSSEVQEISLTCLDYISILKNLDLDMDIEADKVEITNEVLVPNFLPSPNQVFAQIFDFHNDAIAQNPAPIIIVKNKNNDVLDPQTDGFDILYQQGQMNFGSPINAQDNYDIVCRSYFHYPIGLFAEEILETILTEPDGYGNYLFGEASAQDVIDNHLKSTFYTEKGSGAIDTLTVSSATATITIRSKLTQPVSPHDTVVHVTSTDGMPTSGSGTISGQSFTWASKTTTTLNGISSSTLTTHPTNDYVKYEADYAAGQIWYFTYSNITSTLTPGNFTLPGGVSISYIDYRNGRILLNTAASLLATVTYTGDYTFKTLQATGIELNFMSFRSREVDNRFEAVNKIKGYLSPNWIVRTTGDSKIWAGYVWQKVNADFTLGLVQGMTKLEDDDLYTRVKFFTKNNNPTNLLLNENVSLETTGQSYRALASQNGLTYNSTEGTKYVFKSAVSNAGYIVTDFFTPIVYINGIAIDNQIHQMILQPVKVVQTTRTDTTVESSKFGGTSTETSTYYFYRINFPHQNIMPSQDITLYNINGQTIMTIPANSASMDYGRGIYEVPGSSQNVTIENISTATYWVNYSTSALEIDYTNVLFKIDQRLIPDLDAVTVQATYEYYAVFTPQRGAQAIIDGRWDTQLQTEFFAEPPSGYPYAILDLGAQRTIQAVDIIGGFYKPDNVLKFDVDFRISLESSTDNINYRSISDKTTNIQITSGDAIKLEEPDLDGGVTARYIRVSLENVKKVEFGNGVWPVAITEVSIYGDIVLTSEATLIPTAVLTGNVTVLSTTINVDTTQGFSDPDSGANKTVYLGTDGDSFTYTGLTSTSFLGCVVSLGGAASSGTYVYQSVEDDTSLYDNSQLLQKLGDRVYKKNLIDDNQLFSQSQTDRIARRYLLEFYKNHSKIQVQCLYSPQYNMGDTLYVASTDTLTLNVNYFIESITNQNGQYNLGLARYPSDLAIYDQ